MLKTSLKATSGNCCLHLVPVTFSRAPLQELVSLVRHALARAAPRELELLRAAEEMAALPWLWWRNRRRDADGFGDVKASVMLSRVVGLLGLDSRMLYWECGNVGVN